jgi:hypothetical protein
VPAALIGVPPVAVVLLPLFGFRLLAKFASPTGNGVINIFTRQQMTALAVSL